MSSRESSRALAGPFGTLYRLGTVGALTDGQPLERFEDTEDVAASEAAFAALVERHGPVVLNVCRRVLGDPHDAQDAFQATSLVLVRKAGTIRRGDSLGSWLFGIARRVAARACLKAHRRRRVIEGLRRERLLSGEGAAVSATCEIEPDYRALINEIDRLPERFRAPVVLHYFGGLSTEATAQRLGCARGTVLSRLARARDRLRKGLGRRGFSLETIMPPVTALDRLLKAAPVPASLVQATIRAASSLALAGVTLDGIVPATVANLSRGVARGLLLARLRLALALVLMSMAGMSIVLAAAYPAGDPPSDPRQGAMSSRPGNPIDRKARPIADKETSKETKLVRGRVVDPAGKPAAGARVRIRSNPIEPFGSPEQVRLHGATSGADGRIEFLIPREEMHPVGPDSEDLPLVSAHLRGFGPGWTRYDPGVLSSDLTIRLRPDDVPIEGRVIGLEGRPVPGVVVSAFHLWDYPPELFEESARAGGEIDPGLWRRVRNGLILDDATVTLSTRTGADGRFRLEGVGRDRLVTLVLEGGSIQQAYEMVFTSADPTFKPLLMPADESDDYRRHTLSGPRLNVVVSPGRRIEGVIRDGETGRPISGVKTRSWEAEGQSTSDAQGRFRLTSQPIKKRHHIEVVADPGAYIKVVKVIDDPKGLEPIRTDITVRRGVTVEGRVMDRANGRPVNATVQYYPFRDNPHLGEYPDASFFDNALFDETEFRTDGDGRFQAVVLPGGGILAVRSPDPKYLTAAPLAPEVAGNVLWVSNFAKHMPSYQALATINPPVGEKSVIADITLAPGRPQRMEMIGPDGKPVARTRNFCLQQGHGNGEVVPGTAIAFLHRNPGRAERLVIYQEKLGLGASIDIRGDEPDPIRLTLKPLAAVMGRVVDEEGQPRAGVPLSVAYELKSRGHESYLDPPGPG